jgi:pimeloyl-ACP methyl ester carboxylesterase
MKYAIAHPEHARSLILLGPMPPSSALWQQEEQALAAALTPTDTAGAGELRDSAAFAAGDPAAIEAVYGSDEPDLKIGGETLRRILPNATLVTISETGHFPFVERPELVYAAIREFLAANTLDQR